VSRGIGRNDDQRIGSFYDVSSAKKARQSERLTGSRSKLLRHCGARKWLIVILAWYRFTALVKIMFNCDEI